MRIFDGFIQGADTHVVRMSLVAACVVDESRGRESVGIAATFSGPVAVPLSFGGAFIVGTWWTPGGHWADTLWSLGSSEGHLVVILDRFGITWRTFGSMLASFWRSGRLCGDSWGHPGV